MPYPHMRPAIATGGGAPNVIASKLALCARPAASGETFAASKPHPTSHTSNTHHPKSRELTILGTAAFAFDGLLPSSPSIPRQVSCTYTAMSSFGGPGSSQLAQKPIP